MGQTTARNLVQQFINTACHGPDIDNKASLIGRGWGFK